MGLLWLVATGSLAAVLTVPPIAQDPGYHHFADQRPLLGLAHGFDVLSNLPFLVVGLWGLYNIFYANRENFETSAERRPWALLQAAVALTAFGSGYYHFNPTHASLFWDRLPMAIGFSAFLGITVAERIDRTWGGRLVLPLVGAGIASLVYGHPNDLRFYGLLQGWAIVLTGLMLALFPSRYDRTRDVILALFFYAGAKVLELGDVPIFQASGGRVSGHTLKHLAAAAGAACLAWHVGRRRVR